MTDTAVELETVEPVESARLGQPAPVSDEQLVAMLVERVRIRAGVDWEGKGYVFASPVGGPLSPNTDFHVWKRLLRASAYETAVSMTLATPLRPSF